MSDSNETIDEDTAKPVISFTVRFWLYLPVLIPSMLASISIIHHLLTQRNFRTAPKNHITIILLCLTSFSQVTIYPGMLHFYRLDGAWERPLLLRQFWAYIDYTFYVSQISLMALASVQRHVLIFHDRWMATKMKRLCIHYIPIMMVLSYCLIVYAFVYLFPPCHHFYDISSAIGVESCVWDDISYAYYDSFVHQIIPVITFTLFNILLVARVAFQKYRIAGRMQWRKHRKMTIQFMMISSLYMICILPYAIGSMLYSVGVPIDWQGLIINCAIVMSYLPGLLLPFIFIFAYPEIRDKIWHFVRCTNSATIGPIQGPSLTLKPNRTVK